MHISVYRWQGPIDGAWVGRVTANSGVEVEVVSRGNYHYLCLSKPTETLTEVQAEVFRVKMACEMENHISKCLYFLSEEKTEEAVSESKHIMILEQEVARLNKRIEKMIETMGMVKASS